MMAKIVGYKEMHPLLLDQLSEQILFLFGSFSATPQSNGTNF